MDERGQQMAPGAVTPPPATEPPARPPVASGAQPRSAEFRLVRRSEADRENYSQETLGRLLMERDQARAERNAAQAELDALTARLPPAAGDVPAERVLKWQPGDQ